MFTVIIPTHDRPELLGRTLQSLIAQTYPHFTAVIVADSAHYIAPYAQLNALAARYVYMLRGGVPGPAHSRNMGLAVADSDYVLFLDDDDTFEPQHLEMLARHLKQNKSEMLLCDFQVCNEDRTTSPPQYISSAPISIADVTVDSVFVRNRVPNSCIAYRRDVVAGLRYDEHMEIYEDWDFLLHCLRTHTFAHIASPSVVIHKSSANAPENMRRGNSRDDKVVEVMLQLYKKHPALNMETRLARQALMVGAGLPIELAQC